MAKWLRIRRRFFGVALLLLLIVAGWWLARPQAVAVVNETHISEAGIGYRIGVASAYGSTMARETALVGLINDALEREVGRAAGVTVSEKELDTFSAYVDGNSKAPEVLKAVKQVFGTDVKAYRQLYLAPKAINRKLHDWFGRDATVQKQPRAAIQQAYALAVAGNGFDHVAQATGLKLITPTYKAEQKDAPAALRTYFPEGTAMLSTGFRQLLDDLTPGELAQTIAEDDSSYRVVRLLELSGTADARSYKTSEIIATKMPFDPWYQQQLKKVQVDIADKTLRAAIAVKYPALPWL